MPLDEGCRRLRLRFVDDRAEPQVAVARAKELLNRQRVIGLVGPANSVVAVPVDAAAERAGVPMVTPASTSPATTRGRRFVFRTTFTDDVQGAAAARFALQQLRARTAAVLYEATSPYNSGLAASFQRAFGTRPSAYAVSSYDAVRLLVGALQRAGVVDPAAVRDEIDAVTTHDSAVGRLQFGDGGDPQTGAVGLALRGGRGALRWEIPAATRPT